MSVTPAAKRHPEDDARCDRCRAREAGGRYRLTVVALDFDSASRANAGNWQECNLCAHCARAEIYSVRKVERIGPPQADLEPRSGNCSQGEGKT